VPRPVTGDHSLYEVPAVLRMENQGSSSRYATPQNPLIPLIRQLVTSLQCAYSSPVVNGRTEQRRDEGCHPPNTVSRVLLVNG
jgi:hypothetical protein